MALQFKKERLIEARKLQLLGFYCGGGQKQLRLGGNKKGKRISGLIALQVLESALSVPEMGHLMQLEGFGVKGVSPK